MEGRARGLVQDDAAAEEHPLSLSAHWEARPLAIGATTVIPLVYDFYGFPERYYRLQYPSPGAPELAARVRELLRASGTSYVDDPERGLDHGT